ncbi:MAG: UbiX family flavin prenyltransferase [Verrucomicrobiaceae bacterium]|nr:UbiX family flavin prenyltransferase [Verrucomicrobiaceae bacterium]
MESFYKKRIVLGITGASGIAYAIKTAEMLKQADCEIFCAVSDASKMVAQEEVGINLVERLQKVGVDKIYAENDISAPIASGSFRFDAMAVVPCSMKTLGKIANSIADNLVIRASEVALKEKRRLVIVPRETPMATTQIRNMLTLSEAGAVILPASPAFYFKPQKVEEMVSFVSARILASLEIERTFLKEWGM